jgi:hypothetical protein
MKHIAILFLSLSQLGLCQNAKSSVSQGIKLGKKEYFCSIYLNNGKTLSVIIDKDLSLGTFSNLHGRTKEGKVSLPVSEIDSVVSSKAKYVRHEDKFLLLVSEGEKLTLFSSKEVNTRSGIGPSGVPQGSYQTFYTVYYVRKPSQEAILEVPRKKKDFIEFGDIFSDCPYIQNSIKSGSISYEGFGEIVRMYNLCK